MIFLENRLLADDFHVISYLIFVENSERCRKICRLLQIIGGALRVKINEEMDCLVYTQSKLTTSCIVLNLLDMIYVEKQVVIFIYVETYFFSKMSTASNNCLLM